MTIGSRLKEERIRLGITQESLAEFADTTKKTVIDYEKGNTVPKADFLAKVAELGGDVAFIVAGYRAVAEPLAAYELRPDQKALLDHFEHCSEEDKNAVMRMAFLASKEVEIETQQTRSIKHSG